MKKFKYVNQSDNPLTHALGIEGKNGVFETDDEDLIARFSQNPCFKGVVSKSKTKASTKLGTDPKADSETANDVS